MTFDENITRVRELLARRDDIDRELAELIAAGPKPLSVRDKAAWPEGPTSKAEPGRPGKKRPKCSVCGKRGHNVMTCPEGKGLHPNNSRPAPLGGKGRPEKLNEDHFDELKHLQSIDELSSREFADDNGLALSEVNRAISSVSYEDYAENL